MNHYTGVLHLPTGGHLRIQPKFCCLFFWLTHLAGTDFWKILPLSLLYIEFQQFFPNDLDRSFFMVLAAFLQSRELVAPIILL